MSGNQLLVVFTVAAVVNLGFLYLYYTPIPKRLVQDENYYFELAESIATGQDAEHNPLWPPLYAEFMGMLFSAFGTHRIWVQIPQILMWLTGALLFYRIAGYLFPSRIAARTVLLLFLFSPDLIAFSHFLWPEMVHLFLLIAGLWLIICRHRSRFAVVSSGVLFGLALLTKSLLLFFIPVILAFFAVCTSGSRKSRLVNVCLLASVILLTVLPTMVSNLQTSGKFMIANSSIFNTWVGLNDQALVDYSNDIAGREFSEFQRSGADITERNSVYRDKIGLKLQQQGVVNTLIKQLSRQYFRLFDHETYFTTQLPGMPRQAYSANATLLTGLLHLCSNVLYGLILGTAAMGMCFINWRPMRWVHCLLLFVVYNLGLFLFLHVKTRYVIQFLPMMTFFSGVAVHWISRLVRNKPDLSSPLLVVSRPRIILGFVLAAFVEFLAFRSAIVASLP